MKTQRLSAGLELGKTGFVLRTVRPIITESGTIGYLELGEEIGQFSSRLKGQTGFDLAVLLVKSRLNRDDWKKTRQALRLRDNWDDRSDTVVAQSTTENADIMNYSGEIEMIRADGLVLQQVGTRQSMHMRGIFPIQDAAGKVTGAIFVLTDITNLNNAVEAAQFAALMVTLVLCALLCAVVWFVLERLVFRRLLKMTERLEELSLRVAGGDFDLEIEEGGDSRNDEIGRLETFLAQFLRLIGGTLKSLCQ